MKLRLTLQPNWPCHFLEKGYYPVLDYCTLDIIFRQITTFIKVLVAFVFGLQSLWLIDFGKMFQLKGLKPKNKGHTNFYECCDLTEKVYLLYIHSILFNWRDVIRKIYEQIIMMWHPMKNPCMATIFVIGRSQQGARELLHIHTTKAFALWFWFE